MSDERPRPSSDSTQDRFDAAYDSALGTVKRAGRIAFTNHVRAATKTTSTDDIVRAPLARLARRLRRSARAVFALATLLLLTAWIFGGALDQSDHGLAGRVVLTALLCFVCSFLLAHRGAIAVNSLDYLNFKPGVKPRR